MVRGSSRGRAGCWCCAARRASARPRCWGICRRRATGCRVVRAAGVQSEMELAFAGLHALCVPMLDRLERCRARSRCTEHGVRPSAGPPPDRFLVGLAVLSLLAEAAEEQPLVCIVDDAQWLDRVSAQTLAFVARRLLAERVGLVFGLSGPARGPRGWLAGALVEGLPDHDARALLDPRPGPLDPASGIGSCRDGRQSARVARVSARVSRRGRRRVRAAWRAVAVQPHRAGLPPPARAVARGYARLVLLAAAEPSATSRCCGARPSGSGSGSTRPNRPRTSAISSCTCVSSVMSLGTATGTASGWAIMRR